MLTNKTVSVGLYAADYFLMEQKLFNSITNILPQTNLIIAAVLTIVVIYALFQLLNHLKTPHSAVNGAIINDLTNGPHSPGVHESLLINDKCSTFKVYAI